MNKVRELLCFNYDNYQLLIALGYLQLSHLNAEWKYKTLKTKYFVLRVFCCPNYLDPHIWDLVLSKIQ